MAALQRARMACDAAGLVDRETAGSPKLTELGSLLEEVCLDGGRKVVVFSQWERMTRMAEEVARSLGLGTVRLHGGVPSPRRGALIDRFHDDPATQVFLSTDAGGVGLNLQAASVLINLDLPWNPAVLEQRIGRIHRLGQEEPVQVVLLVARDSYEERIGELLDSKRELFLHVVSDEASEDAVGLSKRMVDLALASLEERDEENATTAAGPREAPAPDPDEEAAAGGDAGATGELIDAGSAADLGAGGEPDRGMPSGGSAPPSGDESLAPVVARLQEALGHRIERVEAAGGGLVVVTDTVDPATEELAREVGGEVPVAVLDARSWAALSRLGPLRPAPSSSAAAPPAPPTAASRAERKLAAARILAAEGHGEEGVALATESMLHAAAASAGLATPPPSERVAVWLHGELVPA